jgi:hypothetical protein
MTDRHSFQFALARKLPAAWGCLLPSRAPQDKIVTLFIINALPIGDKSSAWQIIL